MKMAACFILSAVMFSSGNTYASPSFNASCTQTSARLWENRTLDNFWADINNNKEGVYVSNSDGEIWKIRLNDTVEEKILATEEIRRAAMAAVLSGALVNICGNPATSPSTIWAIELVR